MKVYTKQGDQGETSLYGGQKVSKGHRRVEAYGTADEANSFLGMAKALLKDEDFKQIIAQIQQDLFTVGAELATPDSMMQLPHKIRAEDVSRLEGLIDKITDELGPMRGFATPGECLPGAVLDVGRTVVRRMERLLVNLTAEEQINPSLLPYVNRLSDLLFVMARAVARRELKEQVTRLAIEELEKLNLPKGRQQVGLTLDLAQQIIAQAAREAEKTGVPMVLAIVDEGGNLKSLQRMDGALLASVDVAVNKAFSAVALQMPTHEVKGLAQPGGELYGIENTNQGRIVIIGGGFPIYHRGSLLGGIGVSGGSEEEDIRVAQAGLKVLE